VSCGLASVLSVNPAPGYESTNAAQISAAHSEKDDLSLSDAGSNSYEDLQEPPSASRNRSRASKISDPAHLREEKLQIEEHRELVAQ
jgi:hypothetical protein